MGQKSETDGVSESNIPKDQSPILLVEAYIIGSLVGFIQYTCQAKDSAVYCVNDDGTPDRFIKYCLERMVSDLKGYEEEFVVMKEIESKKDHLLEEYGPTEEGDEDESQEVVVHLSEEDTKDLVDAAETWDNLFRNQLKDQTRIPVSEVGLFNSKKAMESPEMLFDNKIIWEELPKDVTRDLSEACRSLAAGCPTSAVFLSLRALEQRLHEWYVEETDNEIEERTFGQVLGEIDDQYDDDSRPRVLDHLDYLVDRRNEVAHAEETPDQQEAENTLMLTRTTISNISEKLSS